MMFHAFEGEVGFTAQSDLDDDILFNLHQAIRSGPNNPIDIKNANLESTVCDGVKNWMLTIKITL